MNKAIKVRHSKTGQEGYVQHVESIDPTKEYYARFKGSLGYFGKFVKGSMLITL